MRLAAILFVTASPAAALASDAPNDAPTTSAGISEASRAAATAMPSYGSPAEEWRSIEHAQKMEECRERIVQVREERGLPDLQRETAQPDEPLFIAAVDQQIEGCSVLVMRHDTSDIRPLPKPPEGPAQIIPAR